MQRGSHIFKKTFALRTMPNGDLMRSDVIEILIPPGIVVDVSYFKRITAKACRRALLPLSLRMYRRDRFKGADVAFWPACLASNRFRHGWTDMLVPRQSGISARHGSRRVSGPDRLVPMTPNIQKCTQHQIRSIPDFCKMQTLKAIINTSPNRLSRFGTHLCFRKDHRQFQFSSKPIGRLLGPNTCSEKPSRAKPAVCSSEISHAPKDLALTLGRTDLKANPHFTNCCEVILLLLLHSAV